MADRLDSIKYTLPAYGSAIHYTWSAESGQTPIHPYCLNLVTRFALSRLYCTWFCCSDWYQRGVKLWRAYSSATHGRISYLCEKLQPIFKRLALIFGLTWKILRPAQNGVRLFKRD